METVFEVFFLGGGGVGGWGGLFFMSMDSAGGYVHVWMAIIVE